MTDPTRRFNGTIWAELDDSRPDWPVYRLRGATYHARPWIKSEGWGTWVPDEKVWRVPKEFMRRLADALREQGFVVCKGRPARAGGGLRDVGALLGLVDEDNPTLPKPTEIDPDFIQHRADVVEAWQQGWADAVESHRTTPDEFSDGTWVEGLVEAFLGHERELRFVLWAIRKKMGDVGVGGDGEVPLGDAAAVDAAISRTERLLAGQGAPTEDEGA